jgi:hypothetical protein
MKIAGAATTFHRHRTPPRSNQRWNRHPTHLRHHQQQRWTRPPHPHQHQNRPHFTTNPHQHTTQNHPRRPPPHTTAHTHPHPPPHTTTTPPQHIAHTQPPPQLPHPPPQQATSLTTEEIHQLRHLLHAPPTSTSHFTGTPQMINHPANAQLAWTTGLHPIVQGLPRYV